MKVESYQAIKLFSHSSNIPTVDRVSIELSDRFELSDTIHSHMKK